jgi:hypothetical protein
MNAENHAKRLQNIGEIRKVNGPKRRLQRRSALEHSQPIEEVGTVSHWEHYRDSSQKINIELQLRGVSA